jgi:hypothetical protein
MLLRSIKPCVCAFGAAVFALALLASDGHAQRSGPFAGLAGSWSGSGTIKTSAGSERIRCQATYTTGGGGTTLQQSLRCASDSYKFEVTSNVTYSGGAVTGTWNETTRQVGGNVTGRISGEQIQVSVQSIGFTAAMSVATRGDTQSVGIWPQGTDVREVMIDLSRSKRRG